MPKDDNADRGKKTQEALAVFERDRTLVANDDVYTTFSLYAAGVLTKEQTLDALKVKKLYNQLVLSSEKALSYLKFLGTVPQEEL